MDDHGNTSEEATSAQGTKLASDLESEMKVPEYDTVWPMPINATWRLMPPLPCRCSRTSSVHLDHIPRDDQCKAGGTGKFSSHRYKTLTPATDDPRDTPTEPPVEDPRESINPHEVSTPTNKQKSTALNDETGRFQCVTCTPQSSPPAAHLSSCLVTYATNALSTPRGCLNSTSPSAGLTALTGTRSGQCPDAGPA
ncbi:hypothetical protein B296_00004520 [Ensete ventricosum]|uniref:Uncharacterized protein n=1 Tax=Ensete ventricosum TaxID=4639 RepID=A0A427AN25_ENSVE|nr:hypothetical protein B296_00004520 [Ensete ventricosum]